MTILLLGAVVQSSGQYNNVWAFGLSAGIDFKTSPPTPISTNIYSNEACATICNASGKLLFYTNGSTVWDADGNIMPNGENLPGLDYNVVPSTSQGTLITPVPGHPSLYYIFSLSCWEAEVVNVKPTLWYSIVDMTLNGGNGDVVADSKGKLLAGKLNLTEQMAAVSGNNCDIWLLVAGRTDSLIHAFHIDFDGIDTVPVTSARVPPKVNGSEGVLGYMDVSPDRTKIAFANTNLVLYDFDATTGRAANPLVLIAQSDSLDMYGVAFSPGSSKLYASSLKNGPGIFQFDISLGDTGRVKASKIMISDSYGKAIRRAPDGRVYVPTSSSGRDLSVIQNPDLYGAACGYVHNGFLVKEGTTATIGLTNTAILTTYQYPRITSSRSDTITCADSFVLSAANPGAKNYLWLDGTLQKTLTIDSSGTYWVSYQNVGYTCEEYTDTFHIVFHKNKRIYSTVVLDALCKEDTLVLQARRLDAPDYTWENDRSGSSRVVREEGYYWVNYRIDSLCALYSDTFIARYPAKDYHVSFRTDTLLCVDDPVLLHNTSDDPFTDFRWTYGEGGSSTVVDPSPYHYVYAGLYPVQLTGWIKGRCADSTVRYIMVDSVFPLLFTVDRGAFCVGENVYFYPRADHTTRELYWQFGEGNSTHTPNESYNQHAYARHGTFVVQLKARNRACPDTETSDTIEVYPLPYIDLGDTARLCGQGQPILLRNRALSADTGSRYYWSTGDTSSTLWARAAGTYSLTITQGPLGCRNTESVHIVKDCYLDIPNAFSPNGDGHNDYFFPRQGLSRGLSSLHFQVVNRWGQVVFESTGLQGRGWDGRWNGQKQVPGVYVYTIKAVLNNGRTEEYKGNVTLLR